MANKMLIFKIFAKNVLNKMFLEFLPQVHCSKIIRTTKSRKSRGICASVKGSYFTE